MSSKYAGSEVLHMAVEIEKKGREFYESVARTQKNEKTQNVFNFLIDEEIRHEKLFKEMLKQVEKDMEKSVYDDTELILYFSALVDRKIFPDIEEGMDLQKQISDPAVALRVALSMEKDSILFYSELLNVTHKKDHAVINQIMEEERDHISRILNLKRELQV